MCNSNMKIIQKISSFHCFNIPFCFLFCQILPKAKNKNFRTNVKETKWRKISCCHAKGNCKLIKCSLHFLESFYPFTLSTHYHLCLNGELFVFYCEKSNIRHSNKLYSLCSKTIMFILIQGLFMMTGIKYLHSLLFLV